MIKERFLLSLEFFDLVLKESISKMGLESLIVDENLSMPSLSSHFLMRKFDVWRDIKISSNMTQARLKTGDSFSILSTLYTCVIIGFDQN